MADFDETMDNLEPRDPEIEYAWHNKVFDDHYYGTGSTTPPRDYLNMTSTLLGMTIALCGLITILGLLGIQLMVEPVQTGEANDISIRFVASTQEEIPAGLEQTASQQTQDAQDNKDFGYLEENLSIHINQSPESVENVPEQTGALSWQEVYERVIPSVVSITCTTGSVSSGGSGVIMTENGYILTNAHVVENAADIQVLLTDGRTFPGRIVGMDEQSDIAVIGIDARDLASAEFGDSTALRVGDQVVAIGDPLGVALRGTMTEGIVSGISRDLTVDSRTMTMIQTTAALNSGNSGGPLVNCYGQVVGINTMKLTGQSNSATVEGLGFAIPTSSINSIVTQLVNQGYVSGRPTMGVEGAMVSSFYQHYYRLPGGLLVSQVDPDSNAADQGIRTGDIILYVNETRITSVDVFEQLVYGFEVGDTVTVTIYRGGREYDLTVALTEDRN